MLKDHHTQCVMKAFTVKISKYTHNLIKTGNTTVCSSAKHNGQCLNKKLNEYN